MSIFKRFSGKKTGDKSSVPENMAIDESEPLVKELEIAPLPRDADDALPSLQGFSDDEKDVIRSILTDQATAPRKEGLAEPTEIEPVTEEIKGFHKRNNKKKKKKTTDDILSDESYKSALSILKGETDADDFDDFDDIEVDADEPITEAYDEEELRTSEAAIEKLKTDYPDRLTASATFTPEIEIEQTNKFSETGEPAEVTSRAEITETTITYAVERGNLGEEDMTSDEPVRTEREETYELRKRADMKHEESLALGQRRVNLGEMRMDVASIISDIESGDSLFRRAQQRVENLTNYIEKAEVDFSLIDRLEPENKALKSENRTLNSELDKRKSKIAQLTSSLEDLQRRYGDAQSELDATHSKLAQAIKNHERADRDISELNAQSQELRLKSDRMRNDLDVESRENGNLRSRLADVTTQLDKTTAEKLSLAKQIETLKIDVTDQSESRIKLRDEVGELRHALDDAQRENTKMKGEIASVHEDIRGFKTQYEFNIMKRDERISDLEAQIVDMNERLRMKEEIIENTTRDISVLRKERTTQDLERERLEKMVSDTHSQLNRAEDELLRSRKAADELDLKYRDVSQTLARAQERRESSLPAQKPDIAPPPMPTMQVSPPTHSNIETDDISIPQENPYSSSISSEDVKTETASGAPAAERIAPTPQITDDIEDMLTDYKLGIRNLG